jgi:hyaluronoglucosaminidase
LRAYFFANVFLELSFMSEFLCGVIEGLYGRTWPWPTRHAMLKFLQEQQLNTYIYAPKADRQLRAAWRESHTSDDFAQLLALRDSCRSRALQFGIGFSPWGLQSGYSAADRVALRKKIRDLNRLDSDIFCILFDDMPGTIDDLAARQCAIVADVLAVCNARRVLVCPTYYSFDPVLEQLFGAMPARYLETLGAGLAARVDVLWTGALVLSPGFSRADIDAVGARLGRKPVLWDNYPVNDGRRISRFLHLLPVRNRPWQLSEWCNGHLANPMNQAFLSQLPLASLAQSYRLRDAYDPEQFWRIESTVLFGAELAALLRRDVELFQRQGLDQLSTRQRESLCEDYRRIDHPAAAEVVDWLNEGYRFDPKCLTG